MNSIQTNKTRWFATILLRYREDGGFWERDAGVWCKAFQMLGLESKLVALGEPAVERGRPLVLATLEQLSDPNWWRHWQPDGVVLFSWALPKYEPVARAIKAAGSKLVIILDTDGVHIPQVWFSRYLYIKYIYSKAEGQPLPALVALAKTLVACIKSRQLGVIRHLEHADVLAIPSPLARERYSRFLLIMKRPDLLNKLLVIHHPIPKEMSYDPAVLKKPIIVAVGGWERLVKDAPLLMRVLGAALPHAPEYRARIIGSGEALLRKLLARLPTEIQTRVELTGPLLPSEVRRHYLESQIIINTSYSEGFTLAVGEALCCGCSAVGTAIMACMTFFCSHSSGTLSCDRSPDNYRDALLAEIGAWRAGERDPVRIGHEWTMRLHLDRVAQSVLELVQTSDSMVCGTRGKR